MSVRTITVTIAWKGPIIYKVMKIKKFFFHVREREREREDKGSDKGGGVGGGWERRGLQANHSSRMGWNLDDAEKRKRRRGNI